MKKNSDLSVTWLDCLYAEEDLAIVKDVLVCATLEKAGRKRFGGMLVTNANPLPVELQLVVAISILKGSVWVLACKKGALFIVFQ